MGEREKSLVIRQVQFLILIGVVLIAIVMLVSSPSTEAGILGIPSKVLFGIAGMVLLVVVAFAGTKILFSNLPKPEEEKEDALSKYGRDFSPGPVSKMVEIKYSERRKQDKKIPFEDYVKTRK